jgi:hypothetical protein
MIFDVTRLRIEQATHLGYNITSLCCSFVGCDTVQSCTLMTKFRTELTTLGLTLRPVHHDALIPTYKKTHCLKHTDPIQNIHSLENSF